MIIPFLTGILDILKQQNNPQNYSAAEMCISVWSDKQSCFSYSLFSRFGGGGGGVL